MIVIHHLGLSNKIGRAVNFCYSTVASRVVFMPRRMSPKLQKNVILTIQSSNIAY